MDGKKEIKDTISELGKKLGYVSFSEVELLPGEILDVVWLDENYKSIYGNEKPRLWQTLSIIKVAFEIELSPWQTKSIRGSIDSLGKTGATLNVLVVSKEDFNDKLQKWRQKHPSSRRHIISKKRSWSSYEDMVKNLREYAQRASARIIVMSIEELEKLNKNLKSGLTKN